MDSKLEFVSRALREGIPFGELCAEYGISRKTGYKWKERFWQDGLAGLEDLLAPTNQASIEGML